MVDVYMGRNQCLDGIQRKTDGQTGCSVSPIGGGLRSLEQAAIDQQAVLRIHEQLMAGAGDAVGGAVMENFWI